MKKTTFLLAAASLLCTSALVPATIAQDEEPANKVFSVGMTVKMGMGKAFHDGMKAYWACYKENGGQETWNAWYPQSGDFQTVVFRSNAQKWAAFDVEDEAGQACRENFNENVIPHVSGWGGSYYFYAGNDSHPGEETTDFVFVRSFDFENTGDAWDLIEAFTKAVKDSEDAKVRPYMWFGAITPTGRWDMSLVFPRKNFGDLPGDDAFWETQKEYYGEGTANRMQRRWFGNIKEMTARFWKRNAEISYAPE